MNSSCTEESENKQTDNFESINCKRNPHAFQFFSTYYYHHHHYYYLIRSVASQSTEKRDSESEFMREDLGEEALLRKHYVRIRPT